MLLWLDRSILARNGEAYRHYLETTQDRAWGLTLAVATACHGSSSAGRACDEISGGKSKWGFWEEILFGGWFGGAGSKKRDVNRYVRFFKRVYYAHFKKTQQCFGCRANDVALNAPWQAAQGLNAWIEKETEKLRKLQEHGQEASGTRDNGSSGWRIAELHRFSGLQVANRDMQGKSW